MVERRESWERVQKEREQKSRKLNMVRQSGKRKEEGIFFFLYNPVYIPANQVQEPWT